jgi:hypothetical protein
MLLGPFPVESKGQFRPKNHLTLLSLLATHLPRERINICNKDLEPVFVNLLRSLGMNSKPGGPVRQPYLSCRTARLHRLAESIPGLLKRLQIRALILFV